MKALILAAGVGKRLRPYTKNTSKCLVKVGEKPILQYQLESLYKNNIRNISIVIGYKREKIIKFINNSIFIDKIKFNFINNKDYEFTNSSYSFYLAYEYIYGSDIICLNSDLIFFPPLIEKVINNKNKNIILVDFDIELDNSIQQVLIKDGFIESMTKSPRSKMDGKACGVAKFSPSTVDLLISKIDEEIRKGSRNDWFYNFIGYNLHQLKIFGFEKGDNILLEVNSKHDLIKAEILIKKLKD